ncbi:hypothetical protein [Actinoplanes italicus]|uniref:Uncharacterized protein n=1 Tax=Actinoplanes italicus TaxID=113567 RepID=A0A2T0JX47_9ACTN|nr:hypothetical protein [Actinoplanes italicus]PRX12578.1 hypothetical protein CLV67_1271 [Actinoplanes italicus]
MMVEAFKADTTSSFTAFMRHLVGIQVKDVVLQAGSFVIIDLVGSAERPAELFDDAVLWIYMAAWRLDVAGQPMVGHEDAQPDMRAAVSSIVGRALTSAQEDLDRLDVVFHFGDVSIKVFPMDFAVVSDGGSVHWAAWSPSGQVLIAGPGARRDVEEAARSQLTAELTYMRDYESSDEP